jgi:hypothetical protein
MSSLGGDDATYAVAAVSTTNTVLPLFHCELMHRSYAMRLVCARQSRTVSEDTTARVQPPQLAVFCEIVSLMPGERLVHILYYGVFLRALERLRHAPPGT